MFGLLQPFRNITAPRRSFFEPAFWDCRSFFRRRVSAMLDLTDVHCGSGLILCSISKIVRDGAAPVDATWREPIPAELSALSAAGRVHDQPVQFRDIVGRKDEVDAATFYCALRHVRLTGCIAILGDRDADNILDAT